jgi:hypothetical protein
VWTSDGRDGREGRFGEEEEIAVGGGEEERGIAGWEEEAAEEGRWELVGGRHGSVWVTEVTEGEWRGGGT